MKSFSALSFSALLVASVSASPIAKRAGQITCDSSPTYSSTLSLTYSTGEGGNDPVYYMGIQNTKTTDHNGNRVPVLISTLDDGSSFTKDNVTKFDLYTCTSEFVGTHGNTGSRIAGVLKPSGDSKNCIQTKSGSVETQDQVMVVAPCSTTDDSSQLQQTWSWDGRHSQIYFLSSRQQDGSHQHPTYFTRSTQNHHALKLNAGELVYPYHNEAGALNF